MLLIADATSNNHNNPNQEVSGTSEINLGITMRVKCVKSREG